MNIALMCGMLLLVNRSAEPWVPADNDSITTAMVTCAKPPTKQPCLVAFVKIEQGRYRAVCGPQTYNGVKLTGNDN